MPRRNSDTKNALRIIRERHELSQSDASKKVGVSRTMWSSWECKTRQLTLTQLGRIKQKLELSEEEVNEIQRWWIQPSGEPAEATTS